jgi:antibiotic biosynthesis monooxygenase (ABM) superfamily enzyme
MTAARRCADGLVSVPLRLRARFGSDPSTSNAEPEPVTVTVARVVRPDRREAFERWAENVLGLASHFPGNLGTSLLRPGPGSSEYHLVYRFEDDDSLAAWERSSERRSALAHVEELVDDARYAFAITSLFQLLVTPHLQSWPVEARLLLSAVVVVLLLGHVAMPLLTRWLARWLRPSRD